MLLSSLPSLGGGDTIDDSSVRFLVRMALKTPEQVEVAKRASWKRQRKAAALKEEEANKEEVVSSSQEKEEEEETSSWWRPARSRTSL